MKSFLKAAMEYRVSSVACAQSPGSHDRCHNLHSTAQLHGMSEPPPLAGRSVGILARLDKILRPITRSPTQLVKYVFPDPFHRVFDYPLRFIPSFY